jgi:hypothetical protein
MQDTEMRVGKMVERKGGQLVSCGIFSCEQNLDGNCFSQVVHVGQIKGIVAPVCLSYIGKLLEEE